MRRLWSMMKLLSVVVLGCVLLIAEAAGDVYHKSGVKRQDAQVEASRRRAVGAWNGAEVDVTAIDAGILPDYWESPGLMLFQVDARVATNGAEPPEQLVKVTDRKHKFPVFATICSISFLAAVITLLVVCTS